MVARIPPPSAIPERVDLEYRDEAEEKTPAVGRRCRGCGGVFRLLDEGHAPPGSYAEAWSPTEAGPGKRAIVLCRGTGEPDDPGGWDWCKVTGILRMPGMDSRFFKDRRVAARPVDNDRRRPQTPPRDDDA